MRWTTIWPDFVFLYTRRELDMSDTTITSKLQAGQKTTDRQRVWKARQGELALRWKADYHVRDSTSSKKTFAQRK